MLETVFRYAKTMNDRSSRSHTIYRINIEASAAEKSEENKVFTSVLHLVDL